jgi:LuxR family maltose regulon positive regulatory protein
VGRQSIRDNEEAGHRPANLPLHRWKRALPPAPVSVIPRPGLVARLLESDSRVISIVAPPGYGKTTLLGEWSARAPRPVYLALDVHDNDPVALVAGIAAALGQVEPLDPALTRLLASPGHSLAATRLPALLDAIWALEGPATLMLDEVHALTDRASLDVIAFVMLRVPPQLRLAIVARHQPALPFGRLRAEGRLLELGAEDLALDEAAGREMAASIGIGKSTGDVAALVARTEGWPAAMYLALRSSASQPSARGLSDFRGTEASVAEYMRSVLLDPLDPGTQWWLRHASVLDAMTGPLCDAALGTTGSLARLRQLEGRNMFVVALDADRDTFRFHRLFRDMLRDQLEELEPGAAAEVCARAAAWSVEHDTPEQAVEYAHASGDMDLTARLVRAYSFPMHWSGRTATLGRWLTWFDRDGEREKHASLAVLAGWTHAMDGRTADAKRWLASAIRSPDPGPMPDGATKDAWIALLRGFMSPHGSGTLMADARAGLDGISSDSPFRQTALILGGFAHLTAGDTDAADTLMAEAVELAEARRSIPGVTLALGERALIALTRGDMAAATRHVERGMALVLESGMEEYAPSVILHAASARTALASGATAEARAAIGHVNRLRPRISVALPILALQARLEVIRAYVMLREGPAARALLFEVKDILRQCPDLGVFVQEAVAIEPMIDSLTGSTAGPWTLTAAELRVLAYLPTHLTFREIAERLYVSPHTVKSHAVAIYGKLGVSTRRGAIEEAVEAGLLDPSAIRVTDAGRVG